MTEFNIWSEGYEATGNHSPATLHGTVKAETFKDACDSFFKDDKLYDPENLTYYACRLYDNFEDARRTFG